MLCDDLEGWDGEWEGCSRGGGICVHIADSHCCTEESNPTFKAIILQIKNIYN